MNIDSILQGWASNSNLVGAVVNLAAELTIVWGHAITFAKMSGFLMFLWALWITWSRDKNQPMPTKKIGLLAFFGTILYGITVFMTYATKSLWPNANPAYPQSYLAQAQSLQESASYGVALLFAVMVIINFFGWIFAIKGAIGLGFAGRKQDVGEAIKTNTMHMFGALLIINFVMFVGDVSSSLSGVNSSFTVNAEF